MAVKSQPQVQSHQQRRDLSILIGIGVVCALVIGGLWIIARDADSAVQQEQVALPVIQADGPEGCTNFANYWMDDGGVNITAEIVMNLTNCRLDSEGNWFVPSGETDPRLTPESALTAEEDAAVDALRNQIYSDIAALENELPRSLQESLKANYDSVNQPVFGHTRKGTGPLGDKRTRYIRISRAFLNAPENAALAEYVAWAMDRKQAASDEFQAACSATPDLQFIARACIGVPGEFQVGYIPLVWDLSDPVLIQEYLIARARSGEPLPSTSATTTTN